MWSGDCKPQTTMVFFRLITAVVSWIQVTNANTQNRTLIQNAHFARRHFSAQFSHKVQDKQNLYNSDFA